MGGGGGGLRVVPGVEGAVCPDPAGPRSVDPSGSRRARRNGGRSEESEESEGEISGLTPPRGVILRHEVGGGNERGGAGIGVGRARSLSIKHLDVIGRPAAAG